MKVLFVCTGNICRSPTAEAVFRKIVEDQGLEHLFTIESAGIHGYHVGEAPDPRTIRVAAQRGYSLERIRARQVCRSDFDHFDVILGLDHSHFRQLKNMRPENCHAKVKVYLKYSGIRHTKEVPDPYYGDASNFEHVLDLVEEASESLLQKLLLKMNKTYADSA